MPDDCRCDVTQVGGSSLYDIEVYESSCPVHGRPQPLPRRSSGPPVMSMWEDYCDDALAEAAVREIESRRTKKDKKKDAKKMTLTTRRPTGIPAWPMTLIAGPEKMRKSQIAILETPDGRKRGHEYTPENTFVRGDGYRECRECMRMRSRAKKARKRALKLKEESL